MRFGTIPCGAVGCDSVRFGAVSRPLRERRERNSGRRGPRRRPRGRTGRGRGRPSRLAARRSRANVATRRRHERTPPGRGMRARPAVVRVSGRPPEDEFRDGWWPGSAVGEGEREPARRFGGSRRAGTRSGEDATVIEKSTERARDARRARYQAPRRQRPADRDHRPSVPVISQFAPFEMRSTRRRLSRWAPL